MTIQQFKILKHLDEQGQLDSIDEKSREAYMAMLRYLEIKSAGIEVNGEKNE
jgi:hypothetical protein